MGTKITFNNITASFQSATAMNAIFDLIEGEFDKCLYTDGTSPNTMQADLDMNSNDILNGGNINSTDITIGGVSLITQINAAAASATAADSSATASAASAASAASLFDSFDDIYLGSKASDPTVDNDGDPLQVGALYYNTTDDDIKVWDSGWSTLNIPVSILSLLDTPSTFVGQAGLFLKVNPGETAVEFSAGSGAGLNNVIDDLTPQLGGDLDVNGKRISAATGNIVIEPDFVSGEINLDAEMVTIEQGLIHKGNGDNLITFATNVQKFLTGGAVRLDIDNSGILLGTSGARVTTILDEDDLVTDSATALATQQSIKAYVDATAGGITRGTAVATTSGTEHDFTIPAGANRIVIPLSAVSVNASVSNLIIQLGTGGGIVTTGYTSVVYQPDSGGFSSTTEFLVTRGLVASSVTSGEIVLTRIDGNEWVQTGNTSRLTVSNISGGSISLAAELTTVRLTTETGTAIFDGGKANVLVWL